jgi:hypothetical protein
LLLAACSDSGITTYADNDPAIPNGGSGGGSCSAVAFTPTPVTPAIQLMVDGSGTMGETIGGTAKYTAVKNSLVAGTTGLLNTLQTKAMFGASVYTSENTCPKLYASACVLDNIAGVSTAITNGGNANHQLDPLDQAIDAVVTGLATVTSAKKVIVLATDGIPNDCNNEGDDHTTQAVTSTTNAYNAGISVYVIGLGNGDGAGTWTSFLQKIANAGINSTTAPAPVQAGSQAAVMAAYQTIFDTVLDCEFTLDGTIDVSQASLGTVKSNGTELTYTTDWTAVDTKTIKLVGQACTDYKAATTLPEITATFTCGASH